MIKFITSKIIKFSSGERKINQRDEEEINIVEDYKSNYSNYAQYYYKNGPKKRMKVY